MNKILLTSAFFLVLGSTIAFANSEWSCGKCNNNSQTCVQEDENGVQSEPVEVQCDSATTSLAARKNSSDYKVYKTGWFSSGKHHCSAYCYDVSFYEQVFGMFRNDYHAIHGSGNTIGEAWSDMISDCIGKLCNVSNDGCWSQGYRATVGNSCE